MSLQLYRDIRDAGRLGDVCEMNLELLRLLQEEALASSDPKVVSELCELYCELADELRHAITLRHEMGLLIEQQRREQQWRQLERRPTLGERRYPN